MPPDVLLIVLAGALLHAGWNLVVKAGQDKYLDSVGMTLGASLCFLPLAFVLPLPDKASWPYLVVSALIHIGYFALVAAAYQRSDMSRSYPIMRGVAPLIVTAISLVFLGQNLSTMTLIGIFVLCSGVILMAGLRLELDQGVLFALINAIVIAVYTLVDGAGVRLTSSALAYTGWLFLLTAPMQLGLACLLRGPSRVGTNLQKRWAWFLLGGIASLGAYATALYGAQRAPVALVAAVREVSILFAVALAAIFLKERLTRHRISAAVLITAGVIMLRLS